MKLTVKKLIRLLDRYDPNAIVMVANGEDELAEIYEADDEFFYGYRDEKGEMFTDEDVREGETTRNVPRVLVLWPVVE
jgi:hypothetical protein